MAKKVYLKGEEFVFTKVKGSSETDYREGDVNINPTNIGLGSVNNTSDKDKPVSTAQQKAIDVAYANSNKYTDQKIANLINGAPETMDTLKEISDAISKSKSTEEALNKAIGTKANQTELDTHTGNDTIHITASEREKWNKNGGVIGVRGSAESDYKTGQVTISKEDIGLGNVDNTTDANKSVKYATSAGSASTSAKVSNKLTIASPINSYNDLYFRDEIVTEAIQYDGSSAMTVNLMNVRSDSYQNTVKFTSNDSTTGDSTAPSLLKSGETHASIFSKVSTIFKNVRWLLSKMGTTDISSLGDGTVTGALSTLNSNKVTNEITATGTQNAIAYSGTCYYHIFGKLCCVIGEFKFSSDYTPTNTQVIFKNLPIPVRPYYITALQYRGGRVDTLFTGSIPFKMRINDAGEIQNWYSGILTIANNPATFSFVYPIK